MKTTRLNRLISLAEKLAEIVKDERLVLDSINSSVLRLKHNELNLVILGQFKRGKSTLANCLLGKEVLPSGVLPLTSIITEIRYGNKESLNVYFEDGKMISFGLSQIASFVTERGNPRNKKKVVRVLVTCNASFLRNDIVLIDTPGIGSTLVHNTKVTQDYVPNCDAAIMLISADSPLSIEEIDFNKSIRQYASKIFFVLNKSDYVSKKEAEEMTAHIRGELAAMGVRINNIFTVSSRLGLFAKIKGDKTMLKDSGVKTLEEALTTFLSRNKSSTLLKSARLRLNSIAISIYNELKTEYVTADMTLENINQKTYDFEKQFDLIKHSALLYSGSIDAEFSDLMNQIDEDMKAAKEGIAKTAHEDVMRALQQKKPDKIDFVEYVNSIIDVHMRKRLTAWRRVEDKKISAQLEAIEKRYAYLVGDINKRLKDASSHIFKFQLKQANPKYSMETKTGFYFKSFGFASDTMMMPSLLDVLPSSIKRKRIMAKLEETVRSDIEANLGRIRYDYLQRLEAGKENFKETLLENLEKTKKGIETGLRKGKLLAARTYREKILIKKDLKDNLKRLSEIIEATA